jgi:hypothetical protein
MHTLGNGISCSLSKTVNVVPNSRKKLWIVIRIRRMFVCSGTNAKKRPKFNAVDQLIKTDQSDWLADANGPVWLVCFGQRIDSTKLKYRYCENVRQRNWNFSLWSGEILCLKLRALIEYETPKNSVVPN